MRRKRSGSVLEDNGGGEMRRMVVGLRSSWSDGCR